MDTITVTSSGQEVVVSQDDKAFSVSMPPVITVAVDVDGNATLDRVTTTDIVVESPGVAVGVVNAGPPGPPGSIGSFSMVPVIEEIDTKIAQHDQGTPIHTTATSGRDFAALFQNGLI